MENQRNRRKRKKSRYKISFRGIVTLILLSVLAVISIFVAYGYNISKNFSKDSIKPKWVSQDQPVNVLLLGVDAGDYESHSSNTPRRSDTMMLVRFNPKDNKVSMLSIPRDTKVMINGHATKINTAHALGGPEMAIKTVEKMLSVNINYYVKLDYEGFREAIDAIGGVDVVIPRDMDYNAIDINIHFKKGEKVHLDGQKAEEFVRWRKNNDGDGYPMGDLGRQATQQEFLIKVIEKLKTPSGVVRIPRLMGVVSKYIKTNIAPVDLLKYAIKLRDVDTQNIEKRNLSGEPKYIDGVSYYIWDKNLKDDFLQKFRSSNDSLRNNDDIDKENIKITILNSTGIAGHAAKYKEKLEALGYRMIETGNYDRKTKATVIQDYSTSEVGKYVLKDLQFGNLAKGGTKATGSDVVIVLGLDSIEK